MPLTLRVRRPNHVAVVDCVGRIVAGPEATALESAVRKCMSEHCDVVLNLSGVEFVDSSGLGLLVRLATSTRNSRTGVRLCSPLPAVQRVIALTMLDRVLQPYETEEKAISSFGVVRHTQPATTPGPGEILCADESSDVLAYLREGLGQAGYRVHSAAIVPDALMLLKAMRPQLVIAGPRFAERLAPCAGEMNVPMIKLPEEFSISDAGDAIATLVAEIEKVLKTSAAKAQGL